jgi:hypothetical protein
VPEFAVRVAEPATGAERWEVVAADSVGEARDILNSKGLLVSRVLPVGESTEHSSRDRSSSDPTGPSSERRPRWLAVGIVAVVLIGSGVYWLGVRTIRRQEGVGNYRDQLIDARSRALEQERRAQRDPAYAEALRLEKVEAARKSIREEQPRR